MYGRVVGWLWRRLLFVVGRLQLLLRGGLHSGSLEDRCHSRADLPEKLIF
jgi:hypothetical protein